jgi:hypothetical protein
MGEPYLEKAQRTGRLIVPSKLGAIPEEAYEMDLSELSLAGACRCVCWHWFFTHMPAERRLAEWERGAARALRAIHGAIRSPQRGDWGQAPGEFRARRVAGEGGELRPPRAVAGRWELRAGKG